jgi:hypothetical protein
MTSDDMEAWTHGVEVVQAILTRQQADRRIGSDFFRIIRPSMRRREAIHSDMLAWLLDPNAGHGLGSSFAQRLVGDILGAVRRPIAGPIATADVRTEVSTGEGRIDLRLNARCGGSHIVIGIENKIDAPVDLYQLHQYALWLKHQYGDAAILVLLTPTTHEGKATCRVFACSFCAMTYQDVITALEGALGEPEVVADAAALARHYLAMLRRDVMPESQPDEIEVFLNTFYAENREAWREIRGRFPSERDESHIALATQVCSRLTRDFGRTWRFAVRPDRYVRVFLPEWSAPLGDSPRDRIVGLPQEAADVARYPHVHFRLSVDVPEGRRDSQWHYAVRLKLDGRRDIDFVNSLKIAIQPHLKRNMKEGPQVTPTLGTRTLPEMPDDQVPLRVLDWFTGHITPIASIIDDKIAHK